MNSLNRLLPFPDLHFDRVSANRARYANYRYRIRDYCPAYLMPGYITHQTPRNNFQGQMVRQPFRRRDWDYMGWKYSLISSIGMGGLNNIINMIPARDPQEYRYFSDKDKAFFKKWLNWTEIHSKYLNQAKPIMGQPAIGKVDGASDILDDEGYIFLYNPNGRSIPANFKLDQSIGLGGHGPFTLSELYPVNKKVGKPEKGEWKYGDCVHIPMDGARAKVLKIKPIEHPSQKPELFNISGKVTHNNHVLRIDSAEGKVGTTKKAMVKLSNKKRIQNVYVNGNKVQFSQQNSLITIPLHFKGAKFEHMQQVGSYDSTFTGGLYKASFTIPKRIFDQLKNRKKKWPIAWTQPNYDIPWLVPQRLLLFVQISQPSDTMNVHMKLNDKSVKLQKAYSSVRPHALSFVGFYIDLSSLKSDKKYHVTLHLPNLKAGQFQGLFFENVATEWTTSIDF